MPEFRGDSLERLIHKQATTGIEEFDENIVGYWDKRQPSLDGFIGKNHTAEEVQEDKDAIHGLEDNLFSKEGKAASQVFYSMMEGIAKHEWLGKNVEVVRTTRYDDVKSGVDFTVIIRQPDKPSIILGIDATSREDATGIEQKIMRSLDGIDHGELAKLKYYRYKGEEAPKDFTVPRLIIGTNAENAERIANSLVTDNAEDNGVQYALLRELESQLRLQLAHALDALRDHVSASEALPSSADAFSQWEDGLPDDVEEQGLDAASIRTLQELMDSNRGTLRNVSGAYGKNAERIAEALTYVSGLRAQKSVQEVPDAIANDQTVRALTHPRRAA